MNRYHLLQTATRHGVWAALFSVAFLTPDGARGQPVLHPNFEPCSSSRGPAVCGHITVPEDHADAASRSIGLRVKILQGSGGAGDPPVFFLAGGPGQAVSDLEPAVVQRFGSALAERDLVLVDQRGTGGSNPLICATEAADDPSRFFGPHYTDEELERCLRRLAPRADVRLYTTTQFVHDLDAVADSLGYGLIDIVGGSYGTKAGLVFMRTHGDRIRAAVLEGVAPPSFLNPLPHARGNKEVLDGLLADCAAESACSTAFPDLRRRFPELLERTQDDPPLVPVPGSSVSVPLERDALTYIVHLLLFSQQASTVVPALIHQVDRGEYALLTQLYAQVVDGLVSGIYFGLQLSVTCSENVPALRTMDLDAETRGTYLGRAMVDGIAEQCEGWPTGSVPDGFHDPVSVDVPTLLITGGRDPATPPGFGDEAAASLSNARLFRVEEGAHITPHPCVDALVTDFLLAGTHEGLDGSCLVSIRRPPFQIPG